MFKTFSKIGSFGQRTALLALVIILASSGLSYAQATQGFASPVTSDPGNQMEVNRNCDPSTTAGRVAVIDLDKIAAAIGRDKVINARVQEFAREQEKKLNQLREELKAQLTQEKEKLGETPNDEDKLRLSRLAEKSGLALRQEIAKVEKVADQLQVKLVLDFKQEVTPFARRVATSRCMGIVMIQQNDLMFIHPASDITDEVIDKVQDYAASVSKAGDRKSKESNQ